MVWRPTRLAACFRSCAWRCSWPASARWIRPRSCRWTLSGWPAKAAPGVSAAMTSAGWSQAAAPTSWSGPATTSPTSATPSPALCSGPNGPRVMCWSRVPTSSATGTWSARTSRNCGASWRGGRGGCGRRERAWHDHATTTEEQQLRWLNGLTEHTAVVALLRVCDSRSWAEQVALRRPYASVQRLQAVADEVWMGLEPDDWLEALAAHPRIGEAGGASSAWSAREQSALGTAADDVRAAIARGNRAYEE